jgi:hypothetical protein
MQLREPIAARITPPVRTAAALMLLTVSFAIPSLSQQGVQPTTGVPINLSILTLHVNGQPIRVYEFTVSLIPMNQAPPWPVGLWLYTYVEADSGSGTDKSSWGEGEWCRWWINEVATLEQQNPQQLPYPYFELNLPFGVQTIQTDEGTNVYPAGSVTCWEASNDYAPS